MKKLIVILIIMLGLPSFAQDFNNVKFIKNHDGDTLNFDLGQNLPDFFRFMPVRLYGIDTPEVNTKNLAEKAKGIQVRDFVTYEMKSSLKIDLVNCEKDKYWRVNCRIQYDNKDLTNELLDKQMGYAYFGGTKATIYYGK